MKLIALLFKRGLSSFFFSPGMFRLACTMSAEVPRFEPQASAMQGRGFAQHTGHRHSPFCSELLTVVQNERQVSALCFGTIAGLGGFEFFRNVTMASAASLYVLAGPGAAPGRRPDTDRRPGGHAERGAEGPSQPGQVCTQSGSTPDQ